MKSGIYTITNILNGKIYVGLSKNIEQRWAVHKSHLDKKKHSCKYLQHAWDAHGKESFLFEILEECEEQYLCSQENWWCNMLDSHNPNRGYNDKPTSPNCKCKQSDATKYKLSEIGKRYTGKNHPFYGKKLSKEHVAKRVKKVEKIVYKYSIEGELLNTYKSVKTAAEENGVSINNISACCSGKQNTSKGCVFLFTEIFEIRKDKRNRNPISGKYEKNSGRSWSG
jgi:hypothetical protein